MCPPLYYIRSHKPFFSICSCITPPGSDAGGGGGGHNVSRKKRRGIIEKRRRDRINNSLSEVCTYKATVPLSPLNMALKIIKKLLLVYL